MGAHEYGVVVVDQGLHQVVVREASLQGAVREDQVAFGVAASVTHGYQINVTLNERKGHMSILYI